jgi:D-3-phosphoglycerate dehydrogenase / 2-oxoglutarate reductase
MPMIKRKIFISTVPFGAADPKPLETMASSDISYTINPKGRRLKEDELAQIIEPYSVLIAGTEPITEKIMDNAPNLRLIARVGIGVDNVDLLAARERNIAVSYTPDAPTLAVGELTLGLMISLLREIPRSDRGMRGGEWWRVQGRRLAECTVGIIGVGRIGKTVIKHLTGAFPGIKILANDTDPDLNFGEQHKLRWTDKETIYRNCDIITLHVPLTPETRGMISKHDLELMKSDAVIINTARGGIISENDLATALRQSSIGGAAIDVFSEEPYSGELTKLENCVLTCHMGSMTQDCRARMECEATDEAVHFLQNGNQRMAVPESEYAVAEMLR